MQECWINVYQGDSLVRYETWLTRDIAVLYSYPHIKVLYRIHVKMDGGYNKDGTRYMNKFREENRAKELKSEWEQANRKIGYLVWNDEKLKYDKWYKDPSLDQDRYDKPNGKCSQCGMELGQHLMPLTVMKSREEILSWMSDESL